MPWESQQSPVVTRVVTVDHLSKCIHAIPTVTSVDSKGVAHLFLENVWRHHGLPNEIISDQGSTFVPKFSKALATLLGVGLTPSTTHHPQTNGQTEHVNQEIKTYLHVFINHHQDDWADWLPIAEFAYNNHIHSLSGEGPVPVRSGLVSTGINPMHRGPASLKGPVSLLSQWSKWIDL